MPAFQILVASYLPSHTDANALCQCMRAARVRAESRGLTGGLLFDGEKFLQLFVGSEPAARAAVDALHDDAAHQNISSLHAGRVEADSRWRDWQVGYTDTAVLDAVLAMATPGLALQAFAQAMHNVDLA